MALSVTSAPWQQVALPALDLRRLLAALVSTEGVTTSGDMAVSQRGAGANYSVDIAAGSALVKGDTVAGQGYYLAYNDATFNLTGFTAANATNPRIDRVVVRVRDAFHGDAANDVSFQILTGTPTGGATLANLSGAPAVGNSQLLLANILIPANATTITTTNIDSSSGVRTLTRAANSTISTIVKPARNTVANTAAESDLFGTAGTGYSIPGGLLGTDGVVKLKLGADLLDNAAGNITVKVYYGASAIYTTNTVVGPTASATHRTFWLDLALQNQAATNAQWLTGYGGIGSATSVVAGVGEPVGISAPFYSDFFMTAAAATVDSTAAQNFRVTWTWSAASASLSVATKVCLIEIV